MGGDSIKGEKENVCVCVERRESKIERVGGGAGRDRQTGGEIENVCERET